jgi:hypothetical protein
MWLGEKIGHFNDWVTQQWVRATGRAVNLTDQSWLDGPVGKTRFIGKDFFVDYAKEHGLEIVQDGGTRGPTQDFRQLIEGSNDVASVAPEVAAFYERTSDYEMDAWSEWSGFFQHFGKALAVVFSRRLQQLNVPLSPLASSEGITSKVVHLQTRGQVVCAKQLGSAS